MVSVCFLKYNTGIILRYLHSTLCILIIFVHFMVFCLIICSLNDSVVDGHVSCFQFLQLQTALLWTSPV